MRNRSARDLVRLLLPAVLGVTLLTVTSVPAVAAAELPQGLSWTATVNGRNVELTSDDRPVLLDPGRPADVVLRVENNGDRPVEVPFVRLEGAVLGLQLYSFTTLVDLRLPAGAADERTFQIQLLDLGAQADGLIPSRIQLLDAGAEEISGKDLTAEVEGEALAIYWLFGVAIGALTLLLLVGGLWRLATGRLHPNRWRRALVFAAPGLGLGFVVTFTLSALGIAAPEGPLWTSLLLAGAAVGFLAGYLTPTPGADDDPEDAVVAGPEDDGEAEDGPAEDGEPAEEPLWAGGRARADDVEAPGDRERADPLTVPER